MSKNCGGSFESWQTLAEGAETADLLLLQAFRKPATARNYITKGVAFQGMW